MLFCSECLARKDEQTFRKLAGPVKKIYLSFPQSIISLKDTKSAQIQDSPSMPSVASALWYNRCWLVSGQ